METIRSTEETKMDKTIRTASNHDKKSLIESGFDRAGSATLPGSVFIWHAAGKGKSNNVTHRHAACFSTVGLCPHDRLRHA